MRNESYFGELVKLTSLYSVLGKHLFDLQSYTVQLRKIKLLISNKKYFIFLLNCRDTPTIIAVIVVFAIALLVGIAIAIIYIFKKSKSSNQFKKYDFFLNIIYNIKYPVHFININIDNLERNTRKSKDTSVDKEEQHSLIQNPVDNGQGNLK